MEDDKYYYIRKISNMSNFYGDKLIDMMEKYDKQCLLDITLEQAKEFYDMLIYGE